MASTSSTCATHGSIESTLAHETSISETEPTESNQEIMSSLSASEQEELSASRIADYLKNPAASHVQPQHVSVHVSLHILSKKKSHIQALENVLSNNKE